MTGWPLVPSEYRMKRTPFAGAPARAVASYTPVVEFHSKVLPRTSGGSIAAAPDAPLAGRNCRNVSKRRRLSGAGKAAAANAACSAWIDVGATGTEWAANAKLAKLGVSNASSSVAILAAVAAGSASFPGPVPLSPPQAAAGRVVAGPETRGGALRVRDNGTPGG